MLFKSKKNGQPTPVPLLPQNGLQLKHLSGLETTSAGGFCSLNSPDTSLNNGRQASFCAIKASNKSHITLFHSFFNNKFYYFK